MNARDMDVAMAAHFENYGSPEERARVIRLRAREARTIAHQRQRDNRSQQPPRRTR